MNPREIVGLRMREIRAAQGLSLRGLAARMQEVVGEPVHASSLQRIEKGASGRGVTVDELLALAVALGVPPIALLTTRQDATPKISVTGDTLMTMEFFRGWISGRHRPEGFVAPTWYVDNGSAQSL